MKDIKYFREEEDKYCQTEREEVEVWDEEIMDWDYKRIPLDFLRQRPFYRERENIYHNKELTKGYDLSDAELTILGMFIMHHSRCFRDDYYGECVPEIAKNMFDVLDSLVTKAPVTEANVLYRECKYPDDITLKAGDVLFVPHNLTCTLNNCVRDDNNFYIIRTLTHSKTRAHDIYRMYPHNAQEMQVNFLRGTKFFVTNVEVIKGTEYYLFYMEELES